MAGWPDFYVVGAPRTATTALYYSMRRHPDVFLPSVKEPHFFSWPEVADTYYRVAIVSDEAKYLDLYSACTDQQLAGDFSTSYLFRTDAAERIRLRKPEAKVVMILRNPADRALSHYRMDVRDGYTDAALTDLLADDAPDGRLCREYIDVGRYAGQVRRYLQSFDRSQLHIVLFDDLVTSPADVLSDLYRFLGIEAGERHLDLPPRNESTAPRWKPVGHLARIASGLGPMIGPRTRRLARTVLYRSGQEPGEDRARADLVELFASDVEDLETLIDRDLTAWRT